MFRPLSRQQANACNIRHGMEIQTCFVFGGFRSQLYNAVSMFTLRMIKLLKPTGHVIHQQFNIQQLYALPTLYLCVLCLSENKQRLVPFTA